MTELAMRLGARIREARERADLTQEALGKLVGLSRASINNIEHGRQEMTVATLYEIAAQLGSSPASFLKTDLSESELPPDVSDFLERVRART